MPQTPQVTRIRCVVACNRLRRSEEVWRACLLSTFDTFMYKLIGTFHVEHFDAFVDSISLPC